MGVTGNNSQPGSGQPGSGQSVPWLYGTTPYMAIRPYFEAEDLLAGLSLPALKALMGSNFSFKEAIMGIVNQIISRNSVRLATGGLNPVSKHSLSCLLAGVLLPIEDWVLSRRSSESFSRKMARATLASLVSSGAGSAIGEYLPVYY